MSTILIAYEREMEQNALQKLLAERGHEVLRANNGVDALETARREGPELIIADISLPKMDGFALLKKWKQDDRLKLVPFVFYTRRHDDPKYERFALELGTDRYLERSTDPSALYKAVDEMLAEGIVARHADTQRLQALATGSFTATSRIATGKSVKGATKSNGANGKARSVLQSVAAPANADVMVATIATSDKKAGAEKPATERPATESSVALPATPVDHASTGAMAALAEAAGEDRSVAREARLLARVTELDALNKQLQASEQRFRQMFEAGPVAMWLINGEDRRCTAVNQAALNLYGYAREEFLALPRGEPPFAAGAPIAGTHATWHRNKSGSAIAVELAVRPVELGIRRGEIVAATDVTQRVFTQQATSHAADAYQAILVASVDGVWLLDEQQKFLDVNEAYCRMSGYTREEIQKLTPADLEMRMHGESTLRLQQSQAAEAAGGQSTYETNHRRKDGSLFPVEASVGSITGARARAVVILRDASGRLARQHAEQQLARAQTAALELFDKSVTWDEQALVRRSLELAGGVTVSPLAFFVSNENVSESGVKGAPNPALTAVFEQSRGVAVNVSGDARKLASNGPSATCLRNGQSAAHHEGRESERSSALPEQRALLLVPIGNGDRCGVLAVANRNQGYSAHEQRLLAPIATALGTILQAKRAQAQTLVSAQRADLALQGIIEGLSRVVERHDPYTSGGPRRVAALVVAMAHALDLTQERQNALRTAGLLHGVGNIAIPSALLSKPSALTTAELALVRTHVEEGKKILSEIEFGSPVADIVYQHHERLDGSGYPLGLKGDAIMLEARILAVADVVEAMCASRPHRPAPGLEAALAEIEQGAGRQYDAQVVQVCTKLFREQGFTLPE